MFHYWLQWFFFPQRAMLKKLKVQFGISWLETMQDINALQGKIYIMRIHSMPPNGRYWMIRKKLRAMSVRTHLWLTQSKKKQKVEGWFAPDLKNNGGPELFFGLPGLILEVNINNGGMIITADKIDLKKLTVELNLPKKIKGKKNQKKITVPIL